jgi:excisionase family DNA binding protein
MAARQPRFSPKQIAQALDVSESTVKRWCDQGSIPMIRTMGGHRRITLDGLQRFILETGRELRLPQMLGMPPLSPLRATHVPGKNLPVQQAFRDRLAVGDEEGCRQVLHDRLAEGGTPGEVAEELITDAMHGFGNAWERHQLDPYQERRGCDVCIRLINELRRELPAIAENAPYAFGGAPEGDPYQLATALVELALREVGWNAVSLGCNLPLESFLQAAHDREPQLVWLSVSTIGNPASFVAQQKSLADALGEEIPLLIGGRALTDAVRPQLRYTAHCDSVSHVVELATMLRWNR